ncbi:L-aspartate oxidase /nicotinate-nucleotide pyrophosphorylase [carboxylating] [Anaeroplasma bactoclasticum]|jgi:L-aspartate oxidase|uniref:L-aspartate oxidase n=1 Tax=Anaeroplasma bactoclasticum TaxID=2088 RepID=A0A397RZ90_9MOLU|nr:L-aspartate oxidase [Anaeroplasma bactoclasticum]RIA75721.1 L-aspartate oxidase /nicotinate-nucleotide pyrophosphorylase [carboxylating] [Anaeroplasma bactoclasticum]
MKKTFEYDVVILGGGLAGIYTALNLNKNLKIAILVKDKIEKGSSNLAQGGIAAEVEFDPDKIEEHYEDTLKAGSYLNDKAATRVLVEEAGYNIKNLISLGVNFDRDSNGELVKTLEGAHRSRRILHAGGDATGAKVMADLRETLAKQENITVYEDEMAFEIIKKNKKAIGLIAINQANEPVYFFCQKIVIATGGVGGIYKNSTNEKFAVGDGIALAYRAGINISNMEFVQFHPTGLYEEEKQGQRFLISEAVRGEGAILKNIEGERFMAKYDKERMELAPRDVVSQAIYREMFDTWSDHVYLDITAKPKEFLMKRFPTIYEKCLSIGVDMSKDLIPVAPIEHFLCGGITTDLLGHTTLGNVYAVGECASTGVHGANRLASNSLLECLVYGNRVAKDINENITNGTKLDKVYPLMNEDFKKYNFKAIRTEIREIMDKYVSIVRTKEGLDIAKRIIEKHYKNLVTLEVMSRYYYETLNMVTIAMIIINAALSRPKSIGCHYMISSSLDMIKVDKIIKDALAEDMPNGDVTTDNLIPDGHQSKAMLIAKANGVISGVEVFRRVFELIGGRCNIKFYKKNGDKVSRMEKIALLEGDTKTILKGERVALNLIQRMCGIATETSKYVAKVKGNTKILDTRKTMPGLRYLDKLAVTHGGGTNHRYSLSDMVMLKDNHIDAAGGITEAVRQIKPKVNVKIEVEVETLDQFKEALNTECDIIMLDNMSLDLMAECVKLNNHKKMLEASGNMSLDRVEEVSLTGVDFISVGAITHSVKALDISLKFHEIKD